MTAREVKDALMLRHPAYDAGLQGPGQWTCVEEWHNIDLLAFNAWASAGPRYGRVGYEVKVSRSDYRRELANPGKRAGAVAFCDQFFFAVPQGLLKDDELAWREPEGALGFHPLERERCPGAFGATCLKGEASFGTVDRRNVTQIRRGIWTYGDRYQLDYSRTYSGPCPTCRGKGWIAESPAVRLGAPKLWVPADVGLVEVSAGGCRIVRNAPKRETKPLHEDHVALLVRHVSYRPDPRHRKAA